MVYSIVFPITSTPDRTKSGVSTTVNPVVTRIPSSSTAGEDTIIISYESAAKWKDGSQASSKAKKAASKLDSQARRAAENAEKASALAKKKAAEATAAKDIEDAKADLKRKKAAAIALAKTMPVRSSKPQDRVRSPRSLKKVKRHHGCLYEILTCWHARRRHV